jgi:prepilin-type N-terminal cleavage/methylation domain-containing protein
MSAVRENSARVIPLPSSGGGPIRLQHGFTLFELVIVAVLVVVFTAAALPGLRPSQQAKLDLATAQVADAIRFARDEAIRTGDPVYVELDWNTDRLLIAEADLSGATVAAGATLRHPIDMKRLDIIVSSAATTSGVEIMNDPFDYPLGGRQPSVVFDGQGLPFRKAGGSYQRMTLGEIDLVLGDTQRTIFLAPITGRVTTQ